MKSGSLQLCVWKCVPCRAAAACCPGQGVLSVCGWFNLWCIDCSMHHTQSLMSLTRARWPPHHHITTCSSLTTLTNNLFSHLGWRSPWMDNLSPSVSCIRLNAVFRVLHLLQHHQWQSSGDRDPSCNGRAVRSHSTLWLLIIALASMVEKLI